MDGSFSSFSLYISLCLNLNLPFVLYIKFTVLKDSFPNDKITFKFFIVFISLMRKFLQFLNSIAIGLAAGNTNQSEHSIAIGADTAYTNQASNCIAIGSNAGSSNQNTKSIAIGLNSGMTTQKNNSIAIGIDCGKNNQDASPIILNKNILND